MAQGIMGSVSSLVSSSKNCRDHKLKKGLQSRRGATRHDSAIDADAKLSHVSGNTDDFFYIKMSQRPRSGEDVTEGLRRSKPNELKISTKIDQPVERSITPGPPRCSSSSVETHNSLRTILGTGLSPARHSKLVTPEPKLNASTGSPSDSGISGSSWTGGSNAEDRGSNPSTRSASVLSDLIHGQHGGRTDRSARIRGGRSPFSDLSSGSVDELVMEQRVEARGSEQILQLQVIQLQEETERLREEMERLVRERENNQHVQFTPTLEEAQWEVCQKAGEISLLKQQLKDSQADVVNKLSEMAPLRSALRDARRELKELEEKNRENQEALKTRRTEMEVCENELQRKKNESEILREKLLKMESELKGLRRDLVLAGDERLELSILKIKLQEQQEELQKHRAQAVHTDSLKEEVVSLKEALEKEKEKKEKILESFRDEKVTWNKEKEKVIRYQKQLQFSYLQVNRRNRDLERTLKERHVKTGMVGVQDGDDENICHSLFSVTE